LVEAIISSRYFIVYAEAQSPKSQPAGRFQQRSARSNSAGSGGPPVLEGELEHRCGRKPSDDE